ncbi:cytochrome P450 [Actinoallomurus purpureus]|uniref:cytochrome P450 n=1 Tax=Actinoallomurus purpureus TaxID=478114 RepID=UPI00209219A4|nr:cytochrome P450 [Actinoallomurus purpureus]MCO6010099.1 cytochrome P450 [Actinoallomurus purpureus]
MTIDTTPSAPFLDLHDPLFAFDGEEIAAAREANWFAPSPIGPIALRHREVSELLRDHRFRLGGEAYMALFGITEGPLFDWWTHTLMSVDAPSHKRLRGLLSKAFTPSVVEGLRPFTRAAAARLADQIATSDERDFVTSFADPLPALVMCEMLGVPFEDYDQFHAWSGDIGLAFATGLTEDVVRVVESGIEGMGAYVESLIARRRRNPGRDLLSALIAAQAQDGSLSAAELKNLVLLLVWAGQDTTSRQLGRALVAFSQHPAQWTLLRQRPELLPQAVNEVLRWTPQSRLIQRFANVELTYQDLHFPVDGVIFCCVPSANYDSRVFENPYEFNIRRVQSSRQLVFGGGLYHCLGHALAQLEIAEGLSALAERLGTPTVSGPIAWRPQMAMIHGPDSLPLVFADSDTVPAPN